MQINSIPTLSVKNNTHNPNFKGTKEIKATEKIIISHAKVSAHLGFMTGLPGSSECILVRLCTDMISKISDLYKIKLEKPDAIKFVIEKMNKHQAEESRLRAIANMVGLGNTYDALGMMRFTTETGKKFVQHCEKLQK